MNKKLIKDYYDVIEQPMDLATILKVSNYENWDVDEYYILKLTPVLYQNFHLKLFIYL